MSLKRQKSNRGRKNQYLVAPRWLPSIGETVCDIYRDDIRMGYFSGDAAVVSFGRRICRALNRAPQPRARR